MSTPKPRVYFLNGPAKQPRAWVIKDDRLPATFTVRWREGGEVQHDLYRLVKACDGGLVGYYMTAGSLAGARRIPVTSPGDILQTEFLDAMGLSHGTLANWMGVKPWVVRSVCAGEMGIDEDLARKLARVLGTTAGFWLNMQQHHDSKNAVDVEATQRAARRGTHISCASAKAPLPNPLPHPAGCRPSRGGTSL